MYVVAIFHDGIWQRLVWGIQTEEAAIKLAKERNEETQSKEYIRVAHVDKFGNTRTILKLNDPDEIDRPHWNHPPTQIEWDGDH